MKILFIISYVLSSFTFSFENAFAGSCSGGECSGGGNTIGNQFHDTYLKNSSFDPEKEKAFALVESIIAKIENQVPKLAEELREALEKNWYLVARKIPQLEKKDTGIVLEANNIRQAAFQNANEVYVDKNWYQNPKVKDEDRAAMILHEMIQSIRIKPGKYMKDYPEATYQLTVFLTKDSNKTEDILKRALTRFHFTRNDSYYTKTEIAQAELKKQQTIEEAKRVAEETVRKEKERLAQIEAWRVQANQIADEYMQSLLANGCRALNQAEDKHGFALMSAFRKSLASLEYSTDAGLDLYRELKILNIDKDNLPKYPEPLSSYIVYFIVKKHHALVEVQDTYSNGINAFEKTLKETPERADAYFRRALISRINNPFYSLGQQENCAELCKELKQRYSSGATLANDPANNRSE
jgi:hypothetical protein